MSFWNNLSSRERLVVAWGLFAVVIVALYVSVLEPRYQRLHVLRQQVPARQQDLAWMEAQLLRYRSLLNNRGGQSVKRKLPLLTVIEQTATASKLRANITRMQPAQGDAVRVWFEDVYFDPWIHWLELLRKQGIQVDAATVSQADRGKVNIRVTLTQ